jgi:hypothetical protein
MPPNFFRDERASVAVIIALMPLVIVAAAGFAFDAGRFYLTQTRDQLAADIAVTAAALAFNTTQDESTAAMQACVAAAMNGVPVTCTTPLPTTVTTTFGTAPNGTTEQGVHVVVSTSLPISAFGALFSAVGQHNTLPVKAGAWAAINANNPPCLLALSPSTDSTPAIDLSGSASIGAAGCGVQSGGPIAVSGAATLGTPSSKAQSVVTGATIEASGSGAVDSTTAPKQNFVFPAPTATKPTDPFANNTTVKSDFSHLTTVESDSATKNNPLPSKPTGGSPDPTPACGATVASGTYQNLTLTNPNSNSKKNPVLTCTFTLTPPISVSGTLTIGDSSGTVGGTVTVTSSGAGTFNINSIANGAQSGVIQITGSTFNIYSGVSTIANASELTLGCSAAFNAATNPGCSATDPNTNTYNIQGGVTTNGASIVFGNGNFTISGGVKLNGGAGCAPNNTLQFGNGNSFVVTDTGVTMNGGCMTFGSAANHDINAGSSSNNAINNSGGTTVLTFGAGTYTLNGGIELSGASTSTGTDMTLVMSGDLNLSAGANNVTWSAPSSAPFLVLTTSRDGGTGSTSPAAVELSGGTSTTLFDGVVYAPNGGVSLSGSAAINENPPAGFCFSLAAQFITQSGGTATAGVCPNSGSGTGGQVALVQ